MIPLMQSNSALVLGKAVIRGTRRPIVERRESTRTGHARVHLARLIRMLCVDVRIRGHGA